MNGKGEVLIKATLIGIGILLLLILVTGGFGVFGEAIGILTSGLKGFFPIFFDIAQSAIEDYLTSPYFIVGIIMAIASVFGIWFGAKGGRILFLIVSIICEIASLISIGTNIF